MSSRRTRRRHRVMQALDLHQLTLPLMWTPAEVRRSLVVLPPFEREHEPEPQAPVVAKRAA